MKKITNISYIFLFLLLLCSSCVVFRMSKVKKSLEHHSLVSKNFAQTIKFRQDGNYIYIMAKVNGDSISREYILDTGSPCLFFPKAKKLLNLQTKQLYNFGKNNKAEYGFTSAEIGSLKYNNLVFLMLKPYYDFEQCGMIGVNVMQNSIWSFNFKDSIITISDDIKYFTDLNESYSVKFKPRQSQETPYIQAVINNKDTVSIMIDSGDNTFIRGYEWDKNKFENTPENIVSCQINWNLYGSNLKKDSITSKKYYKLNSLKIGTYEMNNIVVDGGVYQIGLRFLQNFELTFDWINHTMYFKPHENIEFQSNIPSFGFKVVKYKEKLRVGLLFDKSKATVMGVKLGDEIISINGKNASEIEESTLNMINNKVPIDEAFIFKINGIHEDLVLKKENLFN